MGKVTLDEKYKNYTGVLPPNGHRFYLTNRYGQTVISHCPKNRDPNSLTENQKNSNDEFAQARRIADAELADPLKHEEWLRQWHEAITIGGQDYKTLRGFTIAQIRKNINLKSC